MLIWHPQPPGCLLLLLPLQQLQPHLPNSQQVSAVMWMDKLDALMVCSIWSQGQQTSAGWLANHEAAVLPYGPYDLHGVVGMSPNTAWDLMMQ